MTTQSFDGLTFDALLDLGRLNAQARRVADVMLDGQWRTLREVSTATGDPEASVSARLRDLRKPANGGHTVERRRRPGWAATAGLWEYRLVVAAEDDAVLEDPDGLHHVGCGCDHAEG